jgi:hypothetical protein
VSGADVSTIERVIASTSAGDLLGGLLWRAPTAGKSRARAVREAQSLTSEASHYAQAQVGEQLRYGMYQSRASEESLALPKGVLSAAACFSQRVGAMSPNAALVLMVPAAGARKEDRYYVVCLEDGVPVIDVLSHEIEARNALGAEDRPIWSDNPVAYPNCEPADFEWLALGADKAARLVPVPVNPWPLAIAAVLAASVIGSWIGWQRMREAEARRIAAAEATAADPVPRYLAALAAERPRMAADREALVAAVSEMFAYRVWVPGWRLAAAECSARAQVCTRDWVREGGTWDDLRRAVTQEHLEMITSSGSPVPGLDVARTSRTIHIPRVSLPGVPPHLPNLQDTLAASGVLLQEWRNADLPLELKRPALWPRVPDVPPNFQHAQALLSGEAELHDVPAPFILEALRAAPAFVSWEAVRVVVAEGSDPRALLKFSATGAFYVAAQ